mmetsp:Transcript_10953/g.18086  ORF Transcript_10953/g.18086 Transcript_10953/m.18086 type:complete len:206 (+) Transcript_10953:293-910(+)
MIHGVIVASHGDALHWGLDKFNDIDFAQEVWSFLALGLQLQELYVAPRHMTPVAWDILAEGLQWARREVHILQDSHWAFGDPTERHVYCVASWNVPEARGFTLLHNPVGLMQRSTKFSFSVVLELPLASAKDDLRVTLVKSIAQTTETWTSRVSGAVCEHTAAECTIAAEKEISIELLPGEVLVLAVASAKLSLAQESTGKMILS